MVRFGLVVNPHSRRMRRKQGLSIMLDLASYYGIPVVFPEDSLGPCARSYVEPLKGLLDKNIEVLLVCSGDGGHHLVDTALFSLVKEEEMPMQANLRAGTMNIRAESAGLSRRTLLEILRYSSSEHLLRKFAESYYEFAKKDVPFVQRKLLRVQADDRELFGFAYSSGFVVPFFDRYYVLGGYHLDAFKIIAEAICGLPFPGSSVYRMFDPVQVGVTLDQARLAAPDGYKGILILSQDVAMDFGVVTFHATQFQGINDVGKARFLSIETSGLREMLPQVPSVFTFKGAKPGSFSFPDLIHRDVDRVIIDGSHRFLVDGDLYNTSHSVAVSMTGSLRYAIA